MKETFILRTEWYSSLESLSQEGKAQILDAIFLLHLGEENKISLTDPMAKLCWNFMKSTIENYSTKYWSSVENGKKGGAPKGNKNAKKTTQEQPKTTLRIEPETTLNLQPKTTFMNMNMNMNMDMNNDYVSESVFDSGSVSDSVIDFDKLDFTDYEAQKLVDRYLK